MNAGAGRCLRLACFRTAARCFLVALFLSACAGARAPSPTPAPVSITISGSSAMVPLVTALAEAFEAQHAAVTVVIQPGNSYQGLRQVVSGAADLGAVSVVPSEGLWAAPVALNGIALVVHPNTSLNDLTLAQVRSVFGGQTWRWAELGIDRTEDEILVVSREQGSGTRMGFEALVMAHAADVDCQPALAIDPEANADHAVQIQACEGTPTTPMAVVMPGSAAVVEYVAAHPGAIGYVSQDYVSHQVKAVRLEGLSPAPADVQEGGYPLVQPFYLAAAQEPRDAARQFVDFCLSPEGQAIVAKRHVPVREVAR
jgi:phosphate transport system substrate-binding protein